MGGRQGQRGADGGGPVEHSGDVAETLTQIGVDAAPTTPEELAAVAKAETEKWGKVVKATGASAD